MLTGNRNMNSILKSYFLGFAFPFKSARTSCSKPVNNFYLCVRLSQPQDLSELFNVFVKAVRGRAQIK